MIKKESYAFPIVVNENTDYFHGGLTKREYFAAMAMQAILSKPIDNIKQATKEAVIAADALIKVLNESQP